MESIRKIFTGLDFGGRCIKNVKIDDQPYYVPFNFSDANKNNPVPQEVIKTIASMFSSTIDTDKLPVFYLYFGEIPIPQASVLIQCDVAGTDVETILFLSLADGIDTINSSIVKSAKQLMINGTDGSWELEELPFSSGGGGTSFYTLDLNNYTTNIFNELSAMTLGTTIQVIDTSGRPCLYQIADHEPDYVTINSYMRYDDDDEDPEILSYTLRANGTINGPTVRIRLETMGGGDKFLSDLGRYKEIKIPELINVKVTQAEYNAMESAGTLDNNTIYYIMG